MDFAAEFPDPVDDEAFAGAEVEPDEESLEGVDPPLSADEPEPSEEDFASGDPPSVPLAEDFWSEERESVR